MSEIYEFLRNTPLAKWMASKRARTPELVAAKAKKHGLVLGYPTTANVEVYTVSNQGRVLKTGDLDKISWFVDKYAENPGAYRL